jgi:predicted DNA-binding ribbon-helix-helix protein
MEQKSKMFDQSSLISRNIRIGPKRTSIGLEPQIWGVLEYIAKVRDVSLNEIATEVAALPNSGSFTSAIRIYAVDWSNAASGVKL